MKSIISGFGLILLLLWAIIIQGTIINHSSRANELNNAINNAMIETQRVMYDKSYNISSSDEYVAEFTQNLMQYINSDSDITIKVYSADEDTGLLDIGVVAKYKYRNYNTGNIETRAYEVRRTSIIDEFKNDKYNSEHEKDSYFVAFSIQGDVKVDFTGTLDGLADDNADIDFFIPKESGTTQYKIRILEGTINSVEISDDSHTATVSYSIQNIEGNSYVIIDVDNVHGDATITIQ